MPSVCSVHYSCRAFSPLNPVETLVLVSNYYLVLELQQGLIQGYHKYLVRPHPPPAHTHTSKDIKQLSLRLTMFYTVECLTKKDTVINLTTKDALPTMPQRTRKTFPKCFNLSEV